MGKLFWIVLLLILVTIALFLAYREAMRKIKERYKQRTAYIQQFLVKENRIFPFRYFTDKDGKPLPIVAVTAFFRDEDSEAKYHEYMRQGIHVFGITAYKSFPKKEMLDISEGEFERNNPFDYVGLIRNWLCCFKKKETYGFTKWNNTVDISESDFYSIDTEPELPKKYDFIYVCIKDADHCPMDGWNAVNRNFDLAKKCFPIMCNHFGLKGLVVGREGCGLEKEDYGNQLEVVGWLDYHILMERMRESKFLFVPNMMDASPRVIAEAITKDCAVLMNRAILCGSKYVTKETGELFADEADLPAALDKLLNRYYKMSPKKWWKKHFSQERSQKELLNFLAKCYPGELGDVDRVQFIL